MLEHAAKGGELVRADWTLEDLRKALAAFAVLEMPMQVRSVAILVVANRAYPSISVRVFVGGSDESRWCSCAQPGDFVPHYKFGGVRSFDC